MTIRIINTNQGYVVQKRVLFFFWRTIAGPYPARSLAMDYMHLLRTTGIRIKEV